MRYILGVIWDRVGYIKKYIAICIESKNPFEKVVLWPQNPEKDAGKCFVCFLKKLDPVSIIMNLMPIRIIVVIDNL